MALTHDFAETVQARVRHDLEFRECLLKEGVQCLLAGEIDVARIILRDYIIGTVGLEQLDAVTGKPSESLRRMLDLESAPHAGDLLEVLTRVMQYEGVHLEFSAVREQRDGDDRAVVESVSAG